MITTLLDHGAAPADQVRDTYLTRWSASETTFGEDKTTITGAGNRTSGPVLRSGSPRLVIQEAWAWLTATQLVRASEAAALRSEAAAARALRRRNPRHGHRRRGILHRRLHHAIRSMTSTQVTASSSLHALAAAADAAARACLHTLNIPGRQRHSNGHRKHGRNSRTPAPRRHRHRETPGHRIRARLLLAAAAPQPQEGGTAPPARGRGPWNRAPPPPRHAGRNHARIPIPPSRKQTQRKTWNTKPKNPGTIKHLKYVVLGQTPSGTAITERD